MKTIVVSAVNLRKGGTLAILRDCLQSLATYSREHDVRVVALVHQKELACYEGIEYIELPWSVRSWLHRLWCEYVTMHKISKQIGDIDLWLSLHDTTPRVKARRQAVYCHNSYPFFRWKWRHLFQNYRIVCFALFTKLIYRINIHRNRYLIVQQQWFRNEMSRMFGIDQQHIIVARPNVSEEAKDQKDKKEATSENVSPSIPSSDETAVANSSLFTLHSSLSTLHSSLSTLHSSLKVFLYPAYPDVHKNMECLCEAARILEERIGRDRFVVLLTTSPDINRYSRWLCRRWSDVASLRFCGFVDRSLLSQLYERADCLVFPSQVETWGLPISEFAPRHRPMLLADRPYAHESAAGSTLTAFFPPDDADALSRLMQAVVEGDGTALGSVPVLPRVSPCASDWQQLFDLLLAS